MAVAVVVAVVGVGVGVEVVVERGAGVGMSEDRAEWLAWRRGVDRMARPIMRHCDIVPETKNTPGDIAEARGALRTLVRSDPT